MTHRKSIEWKCVTNKRTHTYILGDQDSQIDWGMKVTFNAANQNPIHTYKQSQCIENLPSVHTLNFREWFYKLVFVPFGLFNRRSHRFELIHRFRCVLRKFKFNGLVGQFRGVSIGGVNSLRKSDEDKVGAKIPVFLRLDNITIIPLCRIFYQEEKWQNKMEYFMRFKFTECD